MGEHKHKVKSYRLPPGLQSAIKEVQDTQFPYSRLCEMKKHLLSICPTFAHRRQIECARLEHLITRGWCGEWSLTVGKSLDLPIRGVKVNIGPMLDATHFWVGYGEMNIDPEVPNGHISPWKLPSAADLRKRGSTTLMQFTPTEFEEHLQGVNWERNLGI